MKKQQVEKKVDKKIEKIEKFADYLGYTEALLQYLRTYSTNQRQGTQSTKTRAEVSGGGRKPWKQKGTGRARVGSSRNPVWVHGGASHGPTPRSWRLVITKSTKVNALFAALATKFTTNSVLILDDLNITKPQTSTIIKKLKELKLTGKTIFVSEKADANVKKSISNIKNVSWTTVATLNPFDIVSNNNVILDAGSLAFLEMKAQ